MKYEPIDLIDYRWHKSSGRYFSNTDIVLFEPVFREYIVPVQVAPPPPPSPEPIKINEEIIPESEQELEYNEESTSENNNEYEEEKIEETTTTGEEQTYEDDIYSYIRQGSDKDTYLLLRQEFDKNIVSLKDSSSYLINLINSGELYDYFNNQYDLEGFNSILEEIENIAWGIFTASDDALYVIDNSQYYNTKEKELKMKNYTYEQLELIRNDAFELISIIRKIYELDSLSPDEKDYLINKILLLRDSIINK